MTVEQFIAYLQKFDGQLPVEIKTYGCGFDHWNADTEDMLVMTKNGNGEVIIEITADWN